MVAGDKFNIPKPTSPVTVPVVSTDDSLLTKAIRRLEAATSRLEDIASSASTFEGQSNGNIGKQDQDHSEPPTASNSMHDLTAMGGAVVAPSASREASTSTVKAVPKKEELPARIEEMDELIAKEVKAFVESSKGIDPLVEEQAEPVAKAFADQRRFLLVTTKAKKPDQQSKTFMDLLADLQQDMGMVGDIRDSHRASPMKEHLAMVGEGVSALQWLVMDGKPADYVGEVLGGSQMYGNRVLKAYKEGDQAHIKFVQSYYALLKALQAYIKKHYPSGITWNNNGTDDPVRAYKDAGSSAPTTNGVSSTSSAGGSGAPPPPPPPLPNFDSPGGPPPPPGPATAAKSGGGSDMGAVFEQLNKGESVTSGLKKVDKSQMTHKNPSLRAGGIVATDPSSNDVSRNRSPGPSVKPKPQSMRQNSTTSTSKSVSAADSGKKLEPKKELDGNKWLIENYDSPSAPIELDVSLSQSVLITRCKNTTIILHGKANAVSIDNSPKTQILVETLVSSVDVIKCPGFAIQITGSLPTIMLDQVDGASVYLGKESLATEVFTSKCSSINIVLPPEKDEDDSRECPLPEQIRTFVKGGKLVSEIVEHAG